MFRSILRRFSTAVKTNKVTQKIKEIRSQSLLGGGQEKIKIQHEKVSRCLFNLNKQTIKQT
jgi:hemin uptake protein HemP